MVIAESTAESSLLEPRLDCELIELETERVDQIISEGAVCDTHTQYELYHLEEKNFEELGSRECCENNITVEALENSAVELTSKGAAVVYNLIAKLPVEPATMVDVQNKEATLSIEPDGQVLLVSEFDFKENSTMENEANQAPGVLYDLIGELPVDGLTSNEKEGNKDDDSDIAGEAEIVPKKKVKKSKKIVKKKKAVKQKAIVAEDECKLQLLEVHEPVVELRTDENEENPDLAPSDEVNNSRRVRKRKKKKSQQPSETGGTIYEAKPKQSEKKKPSGKEKVVYKNKNVDHKVEAKSEGKVKKLKKRKRSQGDAAKGNAGELAAEDAEPKSPESSNKVKTMGMIFMCSSKTKEECFRHNILGLPASKKDIVLSIYKGMRLFLFDFQSRLLYGIYRAKGPGGYNIEPDVFNSNFPSQVRFTILKDCLPLPEEQFKKVIKDNYYARNKFDCQLNSDQVKNLCKLFSATAKKKTKLVGEAPRVGARPIFEQKKKRRAEDDADRDRKKRRAHSDGKWEMERGRANDNGRRPYQTSFSQHTMSSGNPHHAVVYKREAYVPPERPTLSYVALQPLTPPAPAAPAYTLSYPYGRTSGTDIYGQERAIGHQDRGLSYSRLRYLDEGSSGPYPYTSAIGRQDRGLAHSRLHYLDEGRCDLYTEPVVYRNPRYHTSARQDYSSSAVPEDEYRPSSSRTLHYRVPLPPYRRY